MVEKHGNDVRRRRREPGDMLDVPWLFAGVRWGAEALRTVGRARHRFSFGGPPTARAIVHQENGLRGERRKW